MTNNKDISIISESSKFLESLKSTTQLLGVVIICITLILIYVATQLTGSAQITLIIGILLIFFITVFGGIHLEQRRLELSETLPKINQSQTSPSIVPSQTPPSPSPIPNSVFLAAPLDAFGDDKEFETTRLEVLRIKKALITFCGLTKTFYAGTDIKDKGDFEQSSIALRKNFKEMLKCEKFIMIYPEYKISSILVEAGMALALGKDSLWFVKRDEKLPFLLRDAPNAANEGGLPKIRIFPYDTLQGILASIERDGKDLFLKIEPESVDD